MTEPVSILILSRNRSWSLMQTIASIREFTRYPYRIIIQDHASDTIHAEHIGRYCEGADDCRIVWREDFLSCAEGRRFGLEHIDTRHVVFIDDDIKINPLWLTHMMRQMLARERENAAVVVGNLINDRKQFYSGVRKVNGCDMVMMPYGHPVQGDCCAGGCTLYEADALRLTQFRPEYNAGFEDWDQTLQLTSNLGRTLWGCREATFFHNHQADSAPYAKDRWRMTDLMNAAIAIWDRWGIRTAMEKVFQQMHSMRYPLQRHQAIRVLDVLSLGR